MSQNEKDTSHYHINLLVKAAKSYYLDNKTQAEIARKLGISGSTVSRYLSQAKEDGVVRIIIVDPMGRQDLLEEKLCQKYSLDNAVVARVQPAIHGTDSLYQMITTIAAPYIDSLVKPGMVIGIGGSSTVATLVDALKPLATPRNLTFCQVMGEYAAIHSPIRGSEMIRQLAEMYAGISYCLNAPALVEDPTVAEAILRTPGINVMQQYYERLAMMIVGVGPLHGSPLITNGLLLPEHILQLEKAKAVGDICGHFFDTEGQLVDDSYPGQIIAISWQQIRRCPCVIALAAGDNKVQALHALLKAHLLKVLVTDERTARMLIDGLT